MGISAICAMRIGKESYAIHNMSWCMFISKGGGGVSTCMLEVENSPTSKY